MISLSVIMPALNEEDNIEKAVLDVLEGFSTFGIDGELILVNDGSSDGTPGIMRGYAEKYPEKVRVITHLSPMGIGASFWDGVKSAVKDSVVMLPGDAENESAEIFKYVDLMRHVDIIVPYVVNRNVRGFFRKCVSKLFLSVINFSFGLSLNYTNGTVVYRRAVFDDIKCGESGFFYQVEALVKAVKKGYLFAEVPCCLSKRSSGGSKALSLRSFIRVMKAYCRLLKEIYFSTTYKTGGFLVQKTKAWETREKCGEK
ncbi:MAG: glycosyltransferase family 2 protein [Candidatus Omnitrophota bacterium]